MFGNKVQKGEILYDRPFNFLWQARYVPINIHLPGNTSCVLEKILFISPSPGRKAVQMPHHSSISGDQMPPPPGKLPDYCINFFYVPWRSQAVPDEILENIKQLTPTVRSFL